MERIRAYFDRYLLLWIFPLLRKGASSKLSEDDVPPLEKHQTSESLKEQWRREWRDTFEEFDSKRRNGKTPAAPSIIAMFARIFNWRLVFSIGIRIVEDFVHFSKPLLLSLLIEYLSSDDSSFLYGAVIVGGCYFMAQLRSFLYNIFALEQNEMATELMCALRSAINEKSLRLSPSAKSSHSNGDILNIVMDDVYSMFDAVRLMHNFISAPLQFLFAFLLLWRTLGPATIAAITVTAIMVPLNHWTWSYSRQYTTARMHARGERIKICNEMLSGMKVIKLYGWEKAFNDKINKLRAKEVELNYKANLVLRGSDLINAAAPFLMALLCFSIYLFTDNHGSLTPQIALFSLTIFNQIQFPVQLCTSLVYVCSYCKVAHDRIRVFLALEEADSIPSKVEDDIAIETEDASFGWKRGESTLYTINLRVEKGRLISIMGPVGAGKSSLLSAVCGSMELRSGILNRRGSVALVSQQTWLMNNTVKENILFGKEFNEELYETVVKACELEHDFTILPAGDQTIVGENGSLLSGGQKARVSLARAVYQDADIYLLDDPLSAVDVHIGESIYNNVIGPNGLLQDKTRLLVTHNVRYTGANDVWWMEDGSMRNGLKEVEKMKSISVEDEKNSDSGDSDSAKSDNGGAKKRKRIESVKDKDQTANKAEMGEEKLPQQNIWLYLIESAGFWNVFFFVSLQATHFGLQSARSIFVARWSDSDDSTMGSRLWTFSMFGVGEILSFIISCHFLLRAVSKASLNIHRPLLRDVLLLPMRFFDSTPIGEIISRFGPNLDTVDQALPTTIRGLIKCTLQVVSVFFVISYTSPLFILVLIPIVILYVKVLNLFIPCSKQFRAMEQNSRSPIYSYFSESANGIETIRAFQKESFVSSILDTKLDRFSRAKRFVQLSTRWLCQYIDMLANLVVLFAALFAVISCRYLGVAPALAGLSLSYAFSMDMLNMLIHSLSYLEHYKLDIERVQEYSRLDKEQMFISHASGEEWNGEPTVDIENVSLRYADDLPLVLKNISISIGAREKVAVIGRTGSGKSSLTMALFRMVQPIGGRISIYGMNIENIVLKELRSAIAIIPQDPVLFTGSLRSNLDPFDTVSDLRLWHALDQCQMKDTIDSLGGLDCQIDEGGKNLSVGQRQLLCLARVLIRNCKILILDEATSSIDNRSAALIHTVVRERFEHATVISIAHRLESTEGYDKILVLDSGEVAEFDSPSRLLANQDSKYAKMMRK